MLRAFFNMLSRSRLLQRLATGFGPARSVARRFTAGESLDDAVVAVRHLNRLGMDATLNHLGEGVESLDDAKRAADEYVRILRRIHTEGLRASVSIKPSHLGLGFGREFFRARMRDVCAAAADRGIAVELDIEDSSATEDTVAGYHSLLGEFSNLRLALQAYLFRTKDDLAALIERNGRVRLIKGAYDEPAEIAWKKKDDVDASYARLIERSFGDEALRDGFHPAFGTHDHVLIGEVCRMAREKGVGSDRFEFQMLLGVRRDWQEKLAREGYRLRVYVPFGTEWYPYFMRRIAERPANLLFTLRALFGK